MTELKTLVKQGVTRVSWKEQVTESGIQLQGSAMATRYGRVIDTQFMPTGPNEMKLFIVIHKDGTGEIGMVPADSVKVES